MATYSVYSLPGGPLDRVVFVKQGFSWPAFLGAIPWCLWHRQWVAAAFVFTLIVVLGSVFSASAAAMLMLVTFMAAGSWANDLKRWTLISGGYQETQLTQGRSLEEAELRYFLSVNATVSATPAAVPKPLLAAQHEPLGLFGAA